MKPRIVDVAQERSVRRRWIAGDEPRSDVSTADAPADARVELGSMPRLLTIASNDLRLDGSARRAVLAGGIENVATVVPESDETFGNRAQLLREVHPDLVLVLASDAHVEIVLECCEALRYGCADLQPRPQVAVSGDRKAAARLAAALATFGAAALPDVRQADGRAAFVSWARGARRGDAREAILRDEALEGLAVIVARDAGVSTLVVDVSGSSTSLVRAEPGGSIDAVHLVPIGSGVGADRVVARGGLDGVRRWIPWAVDAPALLERIFNRARWPDATPAAPLALALEIALAHEAVAHTLAEVRPEAGQPDPFRDASVIVATGRLAELPRLSQTALLVANALKPTSVATVSVDVEDGLVALGALHAMASRVEGVDVPLAELASLRRSLLAIVPVTAGSKTRVRVSGAATFDETIARGAFFAIPAEGLVEVTVAGSRVGRALAGPLGVLIDARGPVLALPPRDAERVPAVLGWYTALDAARGVVV